MFQDFKDLLSLFSAHNVKYLVVGGYAVSFHAQPRFTQDLDLFIQADPANAKAAFEALREFGAPMAAVLVDDLADPGKFLRFGFPPVAVDILSNVDGVNFEEAWLRRVDAVIDPVTGQIASFISRDDLINSKLAAGRLRDLADVEEIREAKSSTRDEDKLNSGDDFGPG
jgi:hypothetical protein